MKLNPTNPYSRTCAFGLAITCCLLATQSAFAQAAWTGGATPDQNWSTGGNWSGGTGGGGEPGTGQAVVIGATGADSTQGNVNNIVDGSFAAAIGSLTYNQTTSGQYHTTEIGAGNQLTVNGTINVGGVTADAAVTYVSMTGGGTLQQSSGNLVVQNLGSTASTAFSTLDLSGLGSFIYSAGGTVSIGTGNRSQGILTLASVSNHITASTLSISTGGTGNGGPSSGSRLNLGVGTNIVNANTINVGTDKGTAQLRFAGATGGLAIRNSAGTGRANITVASRGASGTAVNPSAVILDGHPVDALIGTLIVGRVTQTSGGATTESGSFSFDNGTVDATTVEIGVSTGSVNATANGTNTVGNGGTLIVGSGGMKIGNRSGSSGTINAVLNINGGTVVCSNNVTTTTTTTTSRINMDGGTLDIQGNSVGTSGARITTFGVTNATLRLTLDGTIATTAKIYIGTLNLPASATPATTIHVDAIANVANPTTFSIINSTTRNGSAASFAVGDYPEGYTVTVTSTATEIQLQVTPPVAGQELVWNGDVNGNWDTTTANWQGSLTYNQSDDAVTFDDTLTGTSTVNLTTTLTPFAITVSNDETNYTFTGSGKLSGAIGLTKDGAGTLTFANDVANDFSGAIALNAGTLVYDQSVDLTVANAISGAGALVKENANTLTLSGASSYTGNTTISEGSLRPNNNAALGALPGGTVTVASGATLDIGANTSVNNANFGAKQFNIAGSGVGGNGAIINNASTNQQNAFQKITLTDDASVGGQYRWDLRGGTPVLDLAGYTLTKTGVNQITVVGGTITGGDIEINQGLFSVETTSSFTGSGTITVNAGGTLGHFRNVGGLFNRPVTLNGGAITNLSGSNAFVGTNSASINLAADSTLGGSSAATYPLVFTGVISGSGKLTKVGAGPVVLADANDYTGDTVVATGALSLSGSGSIADSPVITVATGATLDASARTDGTFTLGASQTLEGNGTVNGAVVVNGTVAPGASVGTLTFDGALTLSSGAVMDLELGDGPTADEASASGAVTYGGMLKLTWTGTTLTTGTVDLFDGSSYAGAFAAIQLVNWPDASLRVSTNNLTTDGSIAITANNTPAAQNLTLGVAQGESVSLPVIGGKFAPADADGDSLNITGVSAATSGTSGFTANDVTYTANGAAGTNTFTYTVSDPFGATDTKTVTVIVYSAQGFNRLAPPDIIGPGTVALSYLGIPGEDYALDHATNLTPPIVWSPVITNTAAGNGVLNFTNSSSATENYFRTRHVP